MHKQVQRAHVELRITFGKACFPFFTHFWSQHGPFPEHFGIFHGPKRITKGPKRAKTLFGKPLKFYMSENLRRGVYWPFGVVLMVFFVRGAKIPLQREGYVYTFQKALEILQFIKVSGFKSPV